MPLPTWRTADVSLIDELPRRDMPNLSIRRARVEMPLTGESRDRGAMAVGVKP